MDDPNLPKIPNASTPAERRQAAKERVSAHLRQKWVPPVLCPICDTDGWSIGDPVDVLVRDPDPVLSGFPIPTYSLIPVFCDNCGYAIFFNGVTAGAVPSFAQLEMEAADRIWTEELASGLEEAEEPDDAADPPWLP